MALTTPIANAVPAFDATQAYTFTFTSSGGTQVTSNTIIIINNTTGATVYTNTNTSFRFENTVPANTLTNNTYYSYYIVTHDANGNYSSNSNVIPFYCFVTPTITFTNIPTTNIINASEYTFSATYAQTNSEILKSANFYLYDNNGDLIDTSAIIYNTAIPPTVLSYTSSGLTNNTTYKIQCVGQTQYNTIVSSALVSFTVEYEAPTVYSVLTLTNNCQYGNIMYNTNIISIDGTSNPTPMTYNNDTVNLTTDGYYVQWASGFTISSDFTMRLWVQSPTVNTTICQITDSSNTTSNPAYLIVNVKQNSSGLYYAELWVYDGTIYPLYMTSTAISSSSEYVICVQRQSGVYDVNMEVYTA